ncbi:MAG: DUF2953 domain-containing protein [Ruminococcaceae bacterium]|nr:DUF2953 domain-containing protein [Oscillospiraceae bacterium]
MTALIILLSILALLLLVLSLPVRFIITCREGVTLRLKILFFGIPLLPKTEKAVKPRRYSVKALQKRQRKAEKKAKKKAAKKQKKAAAKQAARAADAHRKAPLTLKEKLVLVRVLTAQLLKKTHRHLKLTAARLHVRVATGDAATTAILYGAVSASLSYLLLALDRATHLRAKPRDVGVVADYLGDKSSADIKLIFSMRVWGAIALLFSVLFTFLKSKLTHKKAHRTRARAAKQTNSKATA